MRNNYIIHALLLCLFLFLTACSSLPSPTSANLSQTNLQTSTPRTYHPQITLSGRLSSHFEQNNKPQTVYVHFRWVQTPQHILITLDSPTGQTLATLFITELGAQLNQANQPPQFAGDANQLVMNTLGWPLPVNGLRDWLQGFINANHNDPITSLTSKKTFTVDGWSLHYVSWNMENAENQCERPKRLDLTRQTEQAGLVSLRMVIDEWNAQ